MGWHWHQLDHTQIICTSFQTDNHASTWPLSFYRPDALPAAQPTASKHWRHISPKYNNTTIVLWPFVRDYPGEPVPEETFTHPPSWSSSNLYQLLPSKTIHSILPVQITCLAVFLPNLSPCPVWSTSWSGAVHLIFHTFLHPISVFFLQHMPIQAVCGFSRWLPITTLASALPACQRALILL